MKNIPLQVFLTPKQITAELGVEYHHFMRKLRRGQGPKFKRYGTQYRIRQDWYDKWLEEDVNERGTLRTL